MAMISKYEVACMQWAVDLIVADTEKKRYFVLSMRKNEFGFALNEKIILILDLPS